MGRRIIYQKNDTLSQEGFQGKCSGSKGFLLKEPNLFNIPKQHKEHKMPELTASHNSQLHLLFNTFFIFQKLF